jgi:hypothetical protein
MTRDEQIKKEALKECSSFDLPDKEGKFKGVNSAYGLGFCEGAIWADETMIDKACEWLDCFLERTIQRPSQIGLQASDAIDIIEKRRHEIIKMLLEDFREAKFEVFNRIVHFSYKSHDYIMFRDGVGDYSVAGIVHDPDCKCNDSKK